MWLTQTLSDAFAVLGENYMRLTVEKQSLLQGFALMIGLYAVVMSSARFVYVKRRRRLTLDELINVVVSQPIRVGAGGIKDDRRFNLKPMNQKLTNPQEQKPTPAAPAAKLPKPPETEKTTPSASVDRPKQAFTPENKAPPHADATACTPVKSRPPAAWRMTPTTTPAKVAQEGVFSALKGVIMRFGAKMRPQREETRQKTSPQEPVGEQIPILKVEAKETGECSSGLKLPAGITDAVVEIDFARALSKQDALDLQLCFGFIYVDEDKYDEARECLNSKGLINFLVPKHADASDEIYPSLMLARKLNAVLLTNSMSLTDTCKRENITCLSVDSWKNMLLGVPT